MITAFINGLAMLVLTTAASSPFADFAKVRAKYESMKQVSMKISVKMFPEKDHPFQQTGIVKRDGEKIYMSYNNQIVIGDGKYVVACNSKDKTILLSDAFVVSSGFYNEMQLDSAMTGLTYLINTPEEKKLSAVTKNTEYTKIHYTINASDWLLKEVLYEYKYPTQTGLKKIVINYDYSSINKPLDKSVFNISPFVIVKTKSKAVLNNNYSDYELYDQRNF